MLMDALLRARHACAPPATALTARQFIDIRVCCCYAALKDDAIMFVCVRRRLLPPLADVSAAARYCFAITLMSDDVAGAHTMDVAPCFSHDAAASHVVDVYARLPRHVHAHLHIPLTITP